MQSTLATTADHDAFLRRLFQAAHGGVQRELRTANGKSRERLRSEEDVYDRLLLGLDTGDLPEDLETKVVLADLAAAVDADNEYGRVVEEHAALHCLMGYGPEDRFPSA